MSTVATVAHLSYCWALVTSAYEQPRLHSRINKKLNLAFCSYNQPPSKSAHHHRVRST